MVGYSGIGTGFRIIILVLLIAALVLGGLIWFDYLGLLDAKKTIAPVYQVMGIEKEVPDVEDPLLLERERLGKQLDALALRAEELDQREKEIADREAELNQIKEQLDEREQALEDREKVFNEQVKVFENRRENIRQNAAYLVGMPPEDAKEIMLQMDDQEIIDIFRAAEEQAREAGETSLVSYWLSLFPPERAAALQRKMTRKPGG